MYHFRIIIIYFLQMLIVTKVSGTEYEFSNNKQAPEGKNKFSQESIKIENFVDVGFCNSTEFLTESSILRISERLTLECRSDTQIKWIFNPSVKVLNSVATRLYNIESMWKKCDVNGPQNTNDYYFKSILKLNDNLHASDSGEWQVNISCGDYEESRLGGEKSLPTVEVKKVTKSLPNILTNVHKKMVRIEPDGRSGCDNVILDIGEHGSCSCKRKTFIPPQFLICDNLDECQFLTQRMDKFNVSGQACPGKLVNNCNSTGFSATDLNFERSGFLFCTRATGAKMPYVPYIPFDHTNQDGRKKIKILSNEISTYRDFLVISPSQESLTFFTMANFQCFGPKFIFLSDFKWNIQSGNSTADNYLKQHCKISFNTTTFEVDNTIYSNVTIATSEGTPDVNVTIICEAAVRNSNETLKRAITFQLLVPRPVITDRIVCPRGRLLQFECLVQEDHGANVTWHNADTGQTLCNVSVHSCFLDVCPNHTIVCTASKNGVAASKYFTPQNCSDFLSKDENVNCASKPSQKIDEQMDKKSNEDEWRYIPIIGGLLGLCLLVFIPCICILYLKSRRYSNMTQFTDYDVDDFMKGQETGSGKAELSALFLPYNTALEISTDKLKFEATVLGSGAFGKVIQGKVGERTVAIKTVNKSAEIPYFKALLSELKIMSFVGRNENIVELVGACTVNIRKKEVFVVFEFCSNGNVQQFIRQRRGVFENQLQDDKFRVDAGTIRNPSSSHLCSEDLVRWSYQIASGMDFVASLNVYHGDIAARNILLSENLVAKIADFGLSKQLFQYSVYVQKLECPLPLRWLSIEALRDLEFSIQSDVWSYGIALWELYSLGSTPYPGIDWNFQAWKLLNDGHRMDRPDYASTDIHKIMLKCWNENLNDRPTFRELKEMFAEELEKIVRF